jgi:FAD/FMN-containing dehydrogenase
LIVDELLSMNVVLADGSAITVSADSYPDLSWAMRGAGHNFGIVTSFHTRIHPRMVHEWFYIKYTFTQDKLELVFEELNAQLIHGGGPPEVMNDGKFIWIPEISTTEV